MSRLYKFKNNENGQTLVEFALILPILLLLVMGIIQFGIIFSAQIGITNAAREGARVAAVGYSDSEVQNTVSNTVGSHISFNLVSTDVVYPEGKTIGQDVTVTVIGKVELMVPIPDVFVPGGSIGLTAVSTMRVENLPSP